MSDEKMGPTDGEAMERLPEESNFKETDTTAKFTDDGHTTGLDLERKSNGKTNHTSKLSDDDDLAKTLPVAPDGGYGWVIVMASFFNHVIVDGITFTFGVFYIEFLDYFQESKGLTSFVGSLLGGMYLGCAPLASVFVNRYGCRPVAIAGSIIATTGFALCRLSPTVGVLMFTYGAIGGFGLGFMYLPSVISVSFYFEKRRALATGIAVCGAGVGCFIFAPFGQFLLDTLDWKNAMLIVAAITAHGCIFSALLRPIDQPDKKSKKLPRSKTHIDRVKEKVRGRQDSGSERNKDDKMEKLEKLRMEKEERLEMEDNGVEVLPGHAANNEMSVTLIPDRSKRSSQLLYLSKARSRDFHGSSLIMVPTREHRISERSENVSHSGKKFLCFDSRPTLKGFLTASGIYLLADPLFLIPCMANFLGACGLFVPFVYIAERAGSIGVEKNWAAFLLSLIGITNTVGRILMGFLADLPCVSSLLLHNIGLLMAGVVCIFSMFCVNYALLCVFALLFGLCIATWISLSSIILCDLLGIEKLSHSFGILNLTRGVASLLGPPIAGFVYDATKNYNDSFHMAGGMFILAGLLCCLLHMPRLQRRKFSKTPTLKIDAEAIDPSDVETGLTKSKTNEDKNL